MINRKRFVAQINRAMTSHRIVALLGPRQCGKTTLARLFADKHKPENYFDLEDPADLVRLLTPKVTLEALKGLIVIDEIQKAPELFPVLRVLHDQDKERQFLILGSASRELIQQSSESLTGRIQYVEITPFQMQEVNDFQKLWVRGGFPESYLASDEETSINRRRAYVRTFVEQDVPNLGVQIMPQNIMKFWMMIVHYHGQIFNAHEIGNSLDLTGPTAKRYLDILAGTFMIRILQPWYENIKKRQIKSSKIYLRDSGIFHYLSNIFTYGDLLTHPKIGASWEGIAMETIIQKIDPDQYYFWGVHATCELDLLLFKSGKRLGFEFKYSDAPSITPSMHMALSDLKLDTLTVIYPGEKYYQLHERIFVAPLKRFVADS